MSEPQTYQEWLKQIASTPFPPTRPEHIHSYRHEEVMDGYVSAKRGDPMPGANHSSSFRWGWQNAMRDRQHEDDGFDALRHAYLRGVREQEAAQDAATRQALLTARPGDGGAEP